MPLKINLNLLIVNLVKENFKDYNKLKKAFIFKYGSIFFSKKLKIIYSL